MDMCSLAKLKYISCHVWWEIMSVGLLVLTNVPIGLYTFFTAWLQKKDLPGWNTGVDEKLLHAFQAGTLGIKVYVNS